MLLPSLWAPSDLQCFPEGFVGAGRQQGSSTQTWHPQHFCALPLALLRVLWLPLGWQASPGCLLCRASLGNGPGASTASPFHVCIPASISCFTSPSAFLQEAGDNNQFCWRNLFSCINLLRILNKLTKWKHSRTMVRAGDSSGSAQAG